jgi:hypothetical protein
MARDTASRAVDYRDLRLVILGDREREQLLNDPGQRGSRQLALALFQG